jgi:predicted TIM-barrel fold metal-dependent hydrolase
MARKDATHRLLHQELGLEVVDSHAHYLPYSVFKSWGIASQAMQHRFQTRTDMTTIDVPKPDEDLAKRWIAELDRYGISRIGMMVASPAWDEFAAAMRRFPKRFYGYANLNPLQPDVEEQARHAIRDLGFHAFKLYPVADGYHAYDEAPRRIYRVAQDLRVPVLFHFGVSIGRRADLRYGNPLDLQPAARDFPEVRFGIAHIGAGMLRETLLLFYQEDNIYVDTSGSNVWIRYMPYPADLAGVLKRVLEAGGPDRVVFGTDSSMFPRGFRIDILKNQLQILRRLRVPRDDIVQILAGNARSLLERAQQS